MSDKEVKDSYKGFKKEAGGKKIKLDKFTKLVASLNIHRGKKTCSINWGNCLIFYLWLKTKGL